jgi:hypothetical protein
MADISGTAAKNIEGAAAHDALVKGNPVLGGGEARTTLPTAVGDGDVVRSMHDKLGRTIVAPYSTRLLTVHNRIVLTTTSETTLIAQAASTFHDLVFLSFSNQSATLVRVDIRDSTTGTIRYSITLAANGGGAIVKFPVPLTQAAVNTNWTAQLSGAVTSVYITGIAVKNT